MKFLKQMLAALLGCLIASFLSFILAMTIFTSLLPAEEQISVLPSSVLTIDLSVPITEQSIEEPFSLASLLPANPLLSATANTNGILKTVRAIDEAASDPNIKLIFMNKIEFASGLPYLEEVRNALERFRASGKPVIAYAENISTAGYYIASAADKIYMDEMAMCSFLGISSNIIFLKDILDKAGVEMQLIRHGKYKSAGEQFISNKISPANREQNEAMLNAMWKDIATKISASRKISVEELNAKVNGLKYNTAQQMLDGRLIDGIVSKDEMEKILCDLSGAEDFRKMNTITIGRYAQTAVKNNYKAKEKIAVVYADGQINQIGSEGITSEKFLPVLDEIRRDTMIKAVVLRVNSPGGSVQPAEQIRKEIALLAESRPLIVSYGTVAASGGYWISAGAEKIFSNNTTLTGSIGVFSMIPSFEKTLKEVAHVNPVAINTHKHSDMLSLMHPLDEEEQEAMQQQVEVIYDRFIGVVSEGRGLSKERVDEIAQGRVWCGNEALEINLVDEIGGLRDALEYAAIAADLKEYKLVEYPSVKNSLQKAMESLGKSAQTLEMATEPDQMLEQLYRSIKAEKGIYARLPYLYYFE